MLDIPIVGVALDDWDDEAAARPRPRGGRSDGAECDRPSLEAMLARLTYVQGDYGDDATFERVKTGARRRQAAGLLPRDPPSLFATVVKGLGKAGLVEHAHVVIEKPFGHDLNRPAG